QSPENISSLFAQLRADSARARETEELRADWQNQLREAQPEELDKIASILKSALSDLKQLDSDWQLRALNLMASGESQMTFWREFLQACSELYERAFHPFQSIQGFDIAVVDLPPDFDHHAALEELRRSVETGNSPSSFIARFQLSKSAK